MGYRHGSCEHMFILLQLAAADIYGPLLLEYPWRLYHCVVYTGRMQYSANCIERVAIYPTEQTVETNKQIYKVQADELCSTISGEAFSQLRFNGSDYLKFGSWHEYSLRGVGRSRRNRLQTECLGVVVRHSASLFRNYQLESGCEIDCAEYLWFPLLLPGKLHNNFKIGHYHFLFYIFPLISHNFPVKFHQALRNINSWHNVIK